jgi:hypothetical protein
MSLFDELDGGDKATKPTKPRINTIVAIESPRFAPPGNYADGVCMRVEFLLPAALTSTEPVVGPAGARMRANHTKCALVRPSSGVAASRQVGHIRTEPAHEFAVKKFSDVFSVAELAYQEEHKQTWQASPDGMRALWPQFKEVASRAALSYFLMPSVRLADTMQKARGDQLIVDLAGQLKRMVDTRAELADLMYKQPGDEVRWLDRVRRDILRVLVEIFRAHVECDRVRQSTRTFTPTEARRLLRQIAREYKADDEPHATTEVPVVMMPSVRVTAPPALRAASVQHIQAITVTSDAINWTVAAQESKSRITRVSYGRDGYTYSYTDLVNWLSSKCDHDATLKHWEETDHAYKLTK